MSLFLHPTGQWSKEEKGVRWCVRYFILMPVWAYSEKREVAAMAVKLIRRRNPWVRDHPLSESRDVTVRLEWDEAAMLWTVTVPEFHGIRTFGRTQEEALRMAEELILGYIETMQQVGLRLPIKDAAVRRIRLALAG